MLAEKFQSQLGINALATGDFDQLSARGSFKYTNGSDTEETQVGLHRNNYISSIKLGTSLRSGSDLKDINIAQTREHFEDIEANPQGTGEITIQYHKVTDGPEQGLYGDKAVNGDVLPLDEIEFMLSTLKDG